MMMKSNSSIIENNEFTKRRKVVTAEGEAVFRPCRTQSFDQEKEDMLTLRRSSSLRDSCCDLIDDDDDDDSFCCAGEVPSTSHRLVLLDDIILSAIDDCSTKSDLITVQNTPKLSKKCFDIRGIVRHGDGSGV